MKRWKSTQSIKGAVNIRLEIMMPNAVVVMDVTSDNGTLVYNIYTKDDEEIISMEKLAPPRPLPATTKRFNNVDHLCNTIKALLNKYQTTVIFKEEVPHIL